VSPASSGPVFHTSSIAVRCCSPTPHRPLCAPLLMRIVPPLVRSSPPRRHHLSVRAGSKDLAGRVRGSSVNLVMRTCSPFGHHPLTTGRTKVCDVRAHQALEHALCCALAVLCHAPRRPTQLCLGHSKLGRMPLWQHATCHFQSGPGRSIHQASRAARPDSTHNAGFDFKSFSISVKNS
jgi:hypothetical protein